MRNKNGIEIDNLKVGDEVTFFNKSNSFFEETLTGRIEHIFNGDTETDYWEKWINKYPNNITDWYWSDSKNQNEFYAPQGHSFLNSKRPFIVSVEIPGKVKRKLYVPHIDWISKKLNKAVKVSDVEALDETLVEDLLSDTFDFERVEETKSFKDLEAWYERIMRQAQYTEHDIMILMVRLGIFLSQHK